MGWLSPELAAALQASRVTYFAWAEILLPAYALRLVDGSAEVPMDGHVWRGCDPVYGTVGSVKGLADGGGNSAPTLTLGMLPPPGTALSLLLDPAIQGSPVTIGVSALNPTTGLPFGDRCVLFYGELDVPTTKWSERDRQVEWLVGSVGERLFQVEEGRRLSDSFHQKVWPGELGLAFATGVERWVDWGQASRSGQIVTPGAGGGRDFNYNEYVNLV